MWMACQNAQQCYLNFRFIANSRQSWEVMDAGQSNNQILDPHVLVLIYDDHGMHQIFAIQQTNTGNEPFSNSKVLSLVARLSFSWIGRD